MDATQLLLLGLLVLGLAFFLWRLFHRPGKKNQQLTADSVKRLVEELMRQDLTGGEIARVLYRRGMPTTRVQGVLEHFKYGVRWTTGPQGGVLEVSDNPITDPNLRKDMFGAYRPYPFQEVIIPPSVDRQRHD